MGLAPEFSLGRDSLFLVEGILFMTATTFRIVARGLVVHEGKLLFVSNENKYWYIPGGQLEGEETLLQCAEREVFEETGLVVKAGRLVNVLECLDIERDIHRICFYFETRLISGTLRSDWVDLGYNVVQHRRFFSIDEIIDNRNMLPRFLTKGEWRYPLSGETGGPYQGFVRARGFEMIEDLCPID